MWEGVKSGMTYDAILGTVSSPITFFHDTVPSTFFVVSFSQPKGPSFLTFSSHAQGSQIEKLAFSDVCSMEGGTPGKAGRCDQHFIAAGLKFILGIEMYLAL